MANELMKMGDGPWMLTCYGPTYSYQVALTREQEQFLGLVPLLYWDGISRHWAEEEQEHIEKEFEVRLAALRSSISQIPRGPFDGYGWGER